MKSKRLNCAVKITINLPTENREDGRRDARAAVIEFLECRQLLTAVVVNEITDVVYPQGSGSISLRNAIETANASTTPTTITFDPTVFATSQTIILNDRTQLYVTAPEAVTITGPSAPLTINGAAIEGYGGVAFQDSAGCTLSNLDFSGGSISCSGVAVFSNVALAGVDFTNQGQNDATTLTNVPISSGSFRNREGALTVNDCTISGLTGAGVDNNNVYGSATILNMTNDTISTNTGVAISNAASTTLNLIDDTISNNTGNGQYGSIYNNGTLLMTNDTVASNTVTETGSDNFGGAGIYNDTAGHVTVNDVTIADNAESSGGSGAGGGGIFNAGIAADFSLANSIIAGNTTANLGPDVYGGITSLGNNLIGETDGSSGWISSDKTGTLASPLNARLGTLAGNGGYTQTLLPGIGSPAIDGGSNALIPSGTNFDQRGEPRIYDSTVDIGAVELQAIPVATITVTPPAGQSAITGMSQLFSLGSFAQTNTTGPYTVTVHWGDGTTATTFPQATVGTLASQLHTFTNAAVDTVTVTVVDSAGDSSNVATFTATVAQAVSADTTTTLTASASSAEVGTSVTFTAQVTPITAGAPEPTGSVNFLSNGVTLGTATLNSSGQASFTTGVLPLGADQVIALYIGNSTYDSSASSAATVNVSALPVPTVSLTASSASTLAGRSVTLTVDVGATGGGATPTGSVTFLNGDNSLGTAVVLSNGKAVLSVSSTVPGILSYSASYSGSTAYAPESSALVPVTYTSGTTVNVVGPPGLAYVGDSIQLTSTVTAAVAGGPAPSGSVTFLQGPSTLGTGILTNGQAVLTISTLPAGSDAITAVYPGDGIYTGSTSAAVTQIVLAKPNSGITVTSSAGGGVASGQTVTLTVPVVGSGSTTAPTGTVTFTLNGVVLETVPVQGNGTAVFTTTTLPVGSNPIVATYSGDGNYTNSLSVTTIVNINAPGPVINSVLSSTLPVSVISGSQLKGVFKLQIGNPTQTLVKGSTGFILYAVGSDGTSHTLQTSSVNLRITPGKIQTVSFTSKSVLSLTNGTYTLQLGVNTASGQANLITTTDTLVVAAPFTSLISSSLLTTGLTGTVVSGTTAHASIKLIVKNIGNVKFSGPAGFTITASTTTGILGTQIINLTRTLAINPGKTKSLVLPMTTLPALATGSYYIVVQISTPTGGLSTVSSAAPISFTAPVVSLTAGFVSGSSSVLTSGAFITITNTGNIDDLTTFSGILGFATDSAGQNLIAGSATFAVPELHVKAGKNVKVHLTGWQSLASDLTAGTTYYATASLTDDSGHFAFAVNADGTTSG